MPRIALDDPNIFLRYLTERDRNAAEYIGNFTNYSSAVQHLESLSAADNIRMGTIHEAVGNLHRNLVEQDGTMRTHLKKLQKVLQEFLSDVNGQITELDKRSQAASLCSLGPTYQDPGTRDFINIHESWDDLHTYFIGEKTVEKERADIVVTKKAKLGPNKNETKRANTYGDCYRGLFNIYWPRETLNKIWPTSDSFTRFLDRLIALRDEFENNGKEYSKIPPYLKQAIRAYAAVSVGAMNYQQAVAKIRETRDFVLELT